MQKESLHNININELLSEDAAQSIKQMMDTIATVQSGLYRLYVSDDSRELNLVKIGTVFQIFFLDTLAKGKDAKDLDENDWKNIADKVYMYAVIEEGHSYSSFVFTMYADYIDVSAKVLEKNISNQNLKEIEELSITIREKTDQLNRGEINEVSYVDDCLWLSLEAMIKLLSLYLTSALPKEYANLVISASQLAFEYGRYVLYSKEQAMLDQYIKNQYLLDEQLAAKYESFMEEIQIHADRFNKLIEDAFSADVQNALHNSAALAREAGVKEEELLITLEDVDDFFMGD